MANLGGRPPKPTALKVLTGNPGKRRLNKAEPKPDTSELPPCPPELRAEPGDPSTDAELKWHQLSRELHRIGLLSKIDVDALSAYCAAYQRKRDAQRLMRTLAKTDPGTAGQLIRGPDGRVKVNPLLNEIRQNDLVMLRIAVEFGMTPSARVRVAHDAGKNAPGSGLTDDDAEAAEFFGD